MHIYLKDPQSGAGNCTCGAAERHRRHPHEFVAILKQHELCTCGLPFEAEPHQLEGEKNSFLKWFVRGCEDVQFYGYGFADQTHNPGYEDGHVLGMREGENMDFAKAYDIGLQLFDARLKEETK